MAPQTVKRKIISTKHAPTPIGPYSQAVLVDRTLYFSGQMGLNPKTMELVSGGIEAETHQTLENIRQVLKAANCDFKDVVKITILLQDMAHFTIVNEIYAQCFKEHQPARAAYQVAALPTGGLIKIDGVAVVNSLMAGSVHQY
ncbi:2-iminobutanoate/2-iminopropanoate deaminase-like [Tigriopus californicus]|uniref:2-iminobutanoate/2-iminopropanoate deaminase-like n=1 Tax=Tigriopus californicus TaxID=6832 RepID=UPI0027DA6393|nr:2-iminobutanoate/2-iminopropanoate deaminase-like [Tigriopus californicus]